MNKIPFVPKHFSMYIWKIISPNHSTIIKIKKLPLT